METWAPSSHAYPWDRVGLQVGHPKAPVSRVLVTLSVTHGAVKAAKRKRAQLIVSHHPPIWEPLRDLRTDRPRTKLLLDMVQSPIACFAAHTNLDVAPRGVNAILADRLALVNRTPLFPVPHAKQVKLVTFVPEDHLDTLRRALCDAGAGTIGDYDQCSFSTPGEGTFRPGHGANPTTGQKYKINKEPERRLEILTPVARLAPVLEALLKAHPYEEVAYDVVELQNTDPTISLGIQGELKSPMKLEDFAGFVRRSLEIAHVRVSGPLKKSVKTVAVMGGAGGGNVDQVPDSADVFVTGDVKYHDALDAIERGLAIVDAGHHGTEKWIVPAIAGQLKKSLKGLAVSTYVEPDPFTVVTA